MKQNFKEIVPHMVLLILKMMKTVDMICFPMIKRIKNEIQCTRDRNQLNSVIELNEAYQLQLLNMITTKESK